MHWTTPVSPGTLFVPGLFILDGWKLNSAEESTTRDGQHPHPSALARQMRRVGRPFPHQPRPSNSSRRALSNAAPLTCAALGDGRPVKVNAGPVGDVDSLLCGPWWRGSPDASTSRTRSSSALTVTLMSCSRQLHLTVAPASRQTRATVRSIGRALERSLPDLGQAPWCLPNWSNWVPHSHRTSAI